MENTVHSCVDCAVLNCDRKDKKRYPSFCVSQKMDEERLARALKEYEDETAHKIMCASAEIEHDYYCSVTRVEETIFWAQKIGAKKIGIATCVGLLRESRALASLLREYGFEVYGIGCKAGEIPKTDVGIDERCMEVGANMCNPILQAMTLNDEKTDVNIVMGLCVGHDSLFYKYAEAPTTTLVTKDRVTGHNPVAPLNCLDFYYSKLHKKP